jgi:hypothetical protein
MVVPLSSKFRPEKRAGLAGPLLGKSNQEHGRESMWVFVSLQELVG